MLNTHKNHLRILFSSSNTMSHNASPKNESVYNTPPEDNSPQNTPPQDLFPVFQYDNPPPATPPGVMFPPENMPPPNNQPPNFPPENQPNIRELTEEEQYELDRQGSVRRTSKGNRIGETNEQNGDGRWDFHLCHRVRTIQVPPIRVTRAMCRMIHLIESQFYVYLSYRILVV